MTDRPRFRLYTRCPSAVTWAALQPVIRPGDRLWGAGVVDSAYRAMTFTGLTGLGRITDERLAEAICLNGDVETADSTDARGLLTLARARADAWNQAHGTRLELASFLHLNTLAADPALGRLVDTLLFGKSQWVAPELVGQQRVWRNLVVEAQPYIALSRHPGILLGANYQNRGTLYPYTVEELVANIRTVVETLGLGVVGAYYPAESCGTLVEALSIVRG